ncbi:MAG: hypothetical protein KTR32_38335 [Granulosicoccus sp.]|nr:hypothetical protein [Granulosicoccus sp.]
MRILIVVTHLLGAGHLRRSLNLAQAFQRADHEVALVSGGIPIPQFRADGVSVLQLPPVQSDGVSFQRLLKADGHVVTKGYLESRKTRLIELLGKQSPDILITELFPFGRRILKAEFEDLLYNASLLTDKPIVLASIRDILSSPSTTAKAMETDRLVHKYYDAVLVHSDQNTTALDLSWPVTTEMSGKLRYTGYVSQPLSETCTTSGGPKEVVVSAGGGSVGGRLYEVALAAASLTKKLSWRILVGGSNAETEIKRLKAKFPSSHAVTIEPAREDFRQLLLNAECSVSMCGYNTAVDLLQTGTPGVLVPFDAGGETEQRLRADSLSERMAYKTILSHELTPEILIQSIEDVRRVGRFQSSQVKFDGAAESVRIAEELVRARERR